jgi:two-component system chemotaxis response regulator CheB
MCAEPTRAGQDSAIKAIEMGAIEVITKPHGVTGRLLEPWSEDLVRKIRAAAASRPAPPPLPPVAAGPTLFRDTGLDPNRFLVLIGASTGGTEALKRLLRAAPPDFPAIAMVQHMPEGFTAAFARHLDLECTLEISEAVEGDMLAPGKAFLARGGTQMRIVPAPEGPRIHYGETEPFNRHCPSVDVLFDSAIRITGRKLIGVLLTGMGADGAQGLLRLRQAGALTIGQDQRSSVVYGMPKVANDLGAVQIQCCPSDVPRTIINALRTAHSHRPAHAAT